MRAAIVVTLLVGCTNSSPPPCEYAGIADVESRDPSNGQCEDLTPPCDDQCGVCPEQGQDQLAIDWPSCSGPCEGLGAAQCLATADCHAAYQDDSAAQPVFWGCWDMPPSGAIEGSCTGLDAQTCLEHDDCVSIYTGPVNEPPNFVPSFELCQPEPMQAAACSTLTTENACLARSDCDAIYTGTDCTCDAHGCTCQVETFSSCQ